MNQHIICLGFRATGLGLVDRISLVVQYLGELKVNFWDYKEVRLPPKRFKATCSTTKFQGCARVQGVVYYPKKVQGYLLYYEVSGMCRGPRGRRSLAISRL